MDTQLQLPEKLTKKELDNIVYVFTFMSLTAKQTFIAGLITKYPDHFYTIYAVLGDACHKAMAKA